MNLQRDGRYQVDGIVPCENDAKNQQARETSLASKHSAAGSPQRNERKEWDHRLHGPCSKEPGAARKTLQNDGVAVDASDSLNRFLIPQIFNEIIWRGDRELEIADDGQWQKQTQRKRSESTKCYRGIPKDRQQQDDTGSEDEKKTFVFRPAGASRGEACEYEGAESIGSPFQVQADQRDSADREDSQWNVRVLRDATLEVVRSPDQHQSHQQGQLGVSQLRQG